MITDRVQLLVLLVPLLVPLCAQSPQPRFEAASIKPAPFFTPAQLAGGKVYVGMKFSPARVEFGFQSLPALIATAWRVERAQISGPAWMAASQPFDIVAVPSAGATLDDVPEMLRALLEERFGLKVHIEQREQSVYALAVANGGPRLTPAPPVEPGAELVRTIGKTSTTIAGMEFGDLKITPADGAMHMEVSAITMPGLARLLWSHGKYPVVDRTGLAGAYRVAFDLYPGTEMPSLGKLGLKLEATRAVIDAIVIDHAEKVPTEN